MNTCKTCKHWCLPTDSWNASSLCKPLDQDTYEPMQFKYEVRICKMPSQTFCERPMEANGFGLADASMYFAVLATGEEFGCVRHEPA